MKTKRSILLLLPFVLLSCSENREFPIKLTCSGESVIGGFSGGKSYDDEKNKIIKTIIIDKDHRSIKSGYRIFSKEKIDESKWKESRELVPIIKIDGEEIYREESTDVVGSKTINSTASVNIDKDKISAYRTTYRSYDKSLLKENQDFNVIEKITIDIDRVSGIYTEFRTETSSKTNDKPSSQLRTEVIGKCTKTENKF